MTQPELEQRIRERAQELLAAEEVACVIGYSAGTAPLRAAPFFARTADDCGRLVFNQSCANNLALYLVRPRERVAILAKGCDARSVVTLLGEQQCQREQVRIIGLPCRGMISERAVRACLEAPLRDVRGVRDEGEALIIELAGGEQSLPRDEVLMGNCRTCPVTTPAVYDELLGDPIEARHEEYALLAELEAMGPAERRAFWERELGRCIRCYACRQVCPSCHCPECFADSLAPQWALSGGAQYSGNWMWHVGRAQHLAGRCSACGNCERACPVSIPLMLFNKWMERAVQQQLSYAVGLQEGQPQLAALFRPPGSDRKSVV